LANIPFLLIGKWMIASRSYAARRRYKTLGVAKAQMPSLRKPGDRAEKPYAEEMQVSAALEQARVGPFPIRFAQGRTMRRAVQHGRRA
jgi:hypothetical protein